MTKLLSLLTTYRQPHCCLSVLVIFLSVYTCLAHVAREKSRRLLYCLRRSQLPRATRRLATIQKDDENPDDRDKSSSSQHEPSHQADRSSLAVLFRNHDLNCDPVSANANSQSPPLIFVVSDATGFSARSMLLKNLVQFDSCTFDNNDYHQVDSDDDDGPSCQVQIRTFPFVRSTTTLTQILTSAHQKGACVLYTLADPTLRNYAIQTCREQNLVHVDLMGPTLDVLERFLQKKPIGIPGHLLKRTKGHLGEAYYRRVEAVEFTLKADDGQAPWLLPEADLVLVGVSRSGKTPLSVFLSQTLALKVANIPLVMECPTRNELFKVVDARRVFCLTIAPNELRRIRTNRLLREFKGRAADANELLRMSNYADWTYLQKDLKNARELAEHHGWTEIDVTGRAVEETATLIAEEFNKRFPSTTLQGK